MQRGRGEHQAADCDQAKPADRAPRDAGPALLDHGRHYADQDYDRDRQQDVRELAAPSGDLDEFASIFIGPT